MAKPIRVGFIGLNSSAEASFAGQWGKNAHLPYLQSSKDYVITALCNSSLASAQRAIERHGLDASKVHAYGDPISLAKDPDVDLVVCCVRVMEHYDLVKPAIEAGKDVYCEWPLASNLDQMNELASLAKEKKIRTIVGLQGRMGAYVQGIKDLIGDGPGKIGSVLSTSLATREAVFAGHVPQDITYLTRIENGGNLVTVDGIHLLDTLTAALGEIEHYDSVLKNKRPVVSLTDQTFKVVVPEHPSTIHSHLLVHGTLKGDIPFDFSVVGGPVFKDTPGLEWRVLATKGEIRITLPSAHIWTQGGIKLEVFRFESQEVEEVDLSKIMPDTDVGRGLPAPADNIARLYDAFVKRETEKYLDFEQSLKWAKFIQDSYDSAANK